MSRLARRAWFAAALAAVASGCSSPKKKTTTSKSSKKSKTASRERSAQRAAAWNRKHRPQGPQSFSSLLKADDWMKDLDSGSPETRISAAKQLGGMGKAAQFALPKLEKLAGDSNAEVAAAAQAAVDAIKK